MKKIMLTTITVMLISIWQVCLASSIGTINPVLLWEKKLPFKIDDIKMAKGSGDIIFVSNSQIILYDKNGYKRFQWGPRVDRAPSGVDISDNGSIIIYQTNWTEDYIWEKGIDLQKSGWDIKIHYATRKGKELWNKKMVGAGYLSPDGSMVAVGPSGGEGSNLTLLDSNGKQIWEYIYEIGGGLI
ncbi:MAG: hypothetical protein PHE88_11330 [Elusimicrobia bacterium]|nr:hypothetical protein [Elusimicrobiota bacterium]